jgi:hypothetical protein
MNFDHDAGIIDAVHTIDTTTPLPQSSQTGTLVVVGDGAVRIPLGPSSSRPPNDAGLLRFNTAFKGLEYNDGSMWVAGSEENMTYTKRVDFITDELLYRGEAVPGTATSSPSWRVRRITISAVDGDVTEEWASGNANFDKVWDDHLTFIYS